MTKREYLNSLVHDLTAVQELVNSPKVFNWWQGELKGRWYFRELHAELTNELTRINTDKTYKPWKQ